MGTNQAAAKTVAAGAILLAAVTATFALPSVLGRVGSHASAAPLPTCSASSLSLSEHPYGADMTGTYVIYTLRNSGAVACSLSGVPAYAAGSLAGGQPPAVAENRPFGSGSVVGLQPGATASFSAFWPTCTSWIPSQSQTASQAVSQTWTFPGQGPGTREPALDATVGCTNSVVEVSPIQSGVMTTPEGVPSDYVVGSPADPARSGPPSGSRQPTPQALSRGKDSH